MLKESKRIIEKWGKYLRLTKEDVRKAMLGSINMDHGLYSSVDLFHLFEV